MITKRQMLNLDKNKKYLLACSYGSDSMALFSMLLKEGYNFEVAHVNYHFRKESDNEEKELREYSNKYNVNIHVYYNNKKIISNLEARARDIRYTFFKSVSDKGKFDYLLVAHHEDDLIETYLLQKKRKLRPFCYGISEKTQLFGMKVIRPLLSFYKNDLLDYCKKNNVPYAIDQSNLKDEYERNKIRHQIVEKLSTDERTNIKEEIAKDNERVDAIITKLNSLNIHSVKTLLSLTKEEFIYAIQLVANECHIFKISQANLDEISKIIHSSKPNVILYYKDYSFIKEYDSIYFKKEEENTTYSYVVFSPSKLDTPYFYLDFTGDTSNRNVSLDSYPLTIRNANPKDKVKIKDYYKECRRLFIDWKMPMSLRKRWPIIIDKNNEVIYIPRYQSDFVVGKNLNFYVK